MGARAELSSWLGGPPPGQRASAFRSVSCAALSIFTGYMAAQMLHESLTGGYDREAPFTGWKTGPPTLVLLVAVVTLVACRRKSAVWVAAANLLTLTGWLAISVAVGGN